MTSRQFVKDINQQLHKLNYYNLVCVEFPAEKRIVYLSEPQIRLIQLNAAKIYKEQGLEAFDKFVSNFIIYNGRYKSKSKPLTLNTNGKFNNGFNNTFYTINDILAEQLFDLNN